MPIKELRNAFRMDEVAQQSLLDVEIHAWFPMLNIILKIIS